MSQITLYPLRFEPIYQYRLWGGRRLANLLSKPLPGKGPVGEAWLLSDRDDHQSLVADGPLKGWTLAQLMEEFPEQLLGKFVGRFRRFPLLLKFLDAHEMLSVQVHPSDAHADLLPNGETGKTEAWVILEAGPESRVCAGLKPDTNADNLRQALMSGTVEYLLACFTPKPGDGVFIPAGTVHTMGGDTAVFEIQQNSDVTFHLYDWNHIDAKTGKPRELQVDKALACIDFARGAVSPLVPVLEDIKPAMRELLILCEYFGLWRLHGESLFIVGQPETPRILVCIAGEGQLVHDDTNYPFAKGDVMILPAVVGACFCHPRGDITFLQISLPEGT